MSTPRIINVSPHLLMDVIACHSKAWTRHVKGLTSGGEAIKAVAGQAFHAAIAAFIAPDAVASNPVSAATRTADSIDAFHSIYDPAYARIDAAKLEPSLTPQNLHRVLARWIEMHPPAAMPWKSVLMVEEAFVSREWRVHIPNTPGCSPSQDFVTVRLIVRPDAVVLDYNDKVRWVDTKTTGWHITDSGWKADLRLSFQAQLYSDAVAQKYRERALYAGWFNAMELRKLPDDPKRKCAEHKVAYAVCGHEHAKTDFIECMTTAERVGRAVLDAEDAAREFVSMVLEAEKTTDEEMVPRLNMRGSAKGVCRFCPGAGWCEANRPAQEGALSGYFIYDPYPVSEGQRE